LDWCLSTAPDAASSDAVLIRQGLFDKAAMFEDSEGKCMMTMQQSWGAHLEPIVAMYGILLPHAK